ncbi:hypothetical protein F511_41008 [Dorcoceras hygrometricum]|uniref:Dystroglycan-like n=1 Tax=Dorcoceras hygrometricum TaxID=472368 RepID=A0A2Z7BDN0_9LAMI|nr:hypothetical protein F511_41008 [Dorcoceras hygrometricum]
MASSFYSNAQHVDFESVLGMDDPGMVSMFEALVASGLRGFLGCPAIVYEDVLVDFFENASVRSGVIISTVGGQLVEISEALFAESFELPVDGFGNLSEIPKDAVFDARSIVSQSGEPINLSGRKNQMKMPFRLLCDIVAKAISVKAGSFNAITVEKFSLMTAVVCGVKMNWEKYFFGILMKMVTAGSKQSRGFAIQVSLLLATFPALRLGESSEFPSSKVLTKKTVHRFVSINDRDGAEEVTAAAKKKAVSKKRPAADVEAAVPKKKRTVKKKSVSSISSLEMVAVAEEAVPIQQVAEPLDVEEPRCSSTDAVDLIIQQVIEETRAADAPADIAQPVVTEEKHWFDLPYEDLVAQWEAERPVVTASDTDEDLATADVAPADVVQQVEEFEAQISAEDVLSADERKSLEDILLEIPVDVPLPSTCMEVTKIKMGQMIKIPGVSEKTWFLNSLPSIPADDKGKEVLVEKDPVKGNPAKEHYSLICADIDLLVDLRAKVIAEVAKFLHSFSLRKLASINFEEMYKKEEQVLSWGETESPQEAIQRIELLSALHLSLLEELAKEARILGLTWTKPCCSLVFEGSPRDRGTVIARNNTNTRSLCWIRTMIMVDGVWTVEPCADKWVKIPRKVVSTEVPRQRQYDDTLPSMSVFFKLLRKRWEDVAWRLLSFVRRDFYQLVLLSFADLYSWLNQFPVLLPAVLQFLLSDFLSFAHQSADGNHLSVIIGPVSPSQLGGRHSNPVVITPTIAFDFSGTTQQSASHNVALKSADMNSKQSASRCLPFLSLKPAATTSRSIHEKTSQNDIVPTNLNDIVALHQLVHLSLAKQPKAGTRSLQANTNGWSREINQNDDALTKPNDIVKVTSASLKPVGSPVATHYSQQPLAAGSIRNTQNAAFQLNETTSLHFYDWFPKPAAGHSKLTHLLIQ